MVYRVVSSQLFILLDVIVNKPFKDHFEKQYRKWLHFGAVQYTPIDREQKNLKCVLGTGINFRNNFIHGYPKHEGLCSLDGSEEMESGTLY